MDNLKIILEIIDQEAYQRLRQFGEEAKKVVGDINQAQAQANQKQKQAEAGTTQDARAQAAERLRINRELNRLVAQTERDTRKTLENEAKNDASGRKRMNADVIADERLQARLRKEIDREMAEASKKAEQELGAEFKRVRKGMMEQATEEARAVALAERLKQQEMKKSEDGILSIARAYTIMRLAAVVGEDLRAMWKLIGDEIKRASDYMKEWSERLEKSQSDSVRLAAIKGRKPDEKFVAEEARQASRIGLRPDQWRQFQETFFDYAGGQIIPAGEKMGRQEMIREGYRTDVATATAFNARAARYATNVRGLPQDQAAKLAAAVVQTAPAGATADQMMNEYVKLVTAATRMPGREATMVEAIGAVGAEYAKNEEGGAGDWERMNNMTGLLAVEAMRRPEQAVTSTRAFDMWARDVRKNRDKERKKLHYSRMQELGLTDEMMDKPWLAVAQIAKKHEEWLAAGKSDDAFMDRYGGNYRFGLTSFRTAVRRPEDVQRVIREMNRADVAGAERQGAQAVADIHHPASVRADEARTEAAGMAQAAQDAWLRHFERRAMEGIVGRGDPRRQRGLIEAGSAQARAALGFGSAEEQRLQEETNTLIMEELKSLAAGGHRGARATLRALPQSLRQRIFSFGPPEQGELDVYSDPTARSHAGAVLGRILEESQKQTRLLADMQRKQGAPVAAPNAPAPLPNNRVPVQQGVRP